MFVQSITMDIEGIPYLFECFAGAFNPSHIGLDVCSLVSGIAVDIACNITKAIVNEITCHDVMPHT